VAGVGPLPTAQVPTIATTRHQTTSGPRTTLDPLTLTVGDGAAAVAGASRSIPHPMTCPARTITPPAAATPPRPGTAPAPSKVQDLTTPPGLITALDPGTARALDPGTAPAPDTVPARSTAQTRIIALAASPVAVTTTGPVPIINPETTAVPRATAAASAGPGRSAISAPSTPLALPPDTMRLPAMVTATPPTLRALLAEASQLATAVRRGTTFLQATTAALAVTTARGTRTLRLPGVGPATTPPFRVAARTAGQAATSDRQAATILRTTALLGRAVVRPTGQGPSTPARPAMTSSGRLSSLPLAVIVRPPMTAGWLAVRTVPARPIVTQLSAGAPEAGRPVLTGRPGPAA
jgi:hypothetical protein